MWFRNIVRKIKGEPMICRTETATVRIRDFTGEMLEYPALIIKSETLSPEIRENIPKGCFLIKLLNEYLIVPDFQSSPIKSWDLIMNDCVFLSRHYQDLKTQKIIRGRFRKV